MVGAGQRGQRADGDFCMESSREGGEGAGRGGRAHVSTLRHDRLLLSVENSGKSWHEG